MKVSHAVVLLLFVTVALASFSLLGQDANKSPQQEWEYTIRQYNHGSTTKTNEVGAEGWELVAVEPTYSVDGTPQNQFFYYFKRPMP